MGTCWNCNIEITLQENRTECDNCGKTLFYKCNTCKGEFEIKDKKTEKQLETCKLCGFFRCPHCNVCKYTCKRYEWQSEIMKILSPEFNFMTYPKLKEKVERIICYIENSKLTIERKNCPERNVPITYAKNKIKSLLGRFEGYGVKDIEDQSAFKKRIEEITDKESGEKFIISDIREKGSYGQEYRDAFNLCVCLGRIKIQRVKNEKGIEYDLFVRCNNKICPFLNVKDLIINYCTKCKKRYELTDTYCNICPPYKKGKNQGEQRKLKKRLNDKDTCQAYRGDFKYGRD